MLASPNFTSIPHFENLTLRYLNYITGNPFCQVCFYKKLHNNIIMKITYDVQQSFVERLKELMADNQNLNIKRVKF